MNNIEKKFVSAVIYVHNAESTIENFLRNLINVMDNNFEHSEIICVNDASTDNSVDKIKSVNLESTTTVITVVNMSYFHGLEIAMNAGVELSIGDYVFEFDSTVADYSFDIIMDCYRRCLEGYDIVSAMPNKKEKWTSRIFYKIVYKYSDIADKMGTESLRVLSRRVINRVSAMNATVPYRKIVYAGSGLKTDKVVYKSEETKKRTIDKKEQKFRSRLATDSLIIFTEVGYRFSITMSFLMMLLSLFMVVYSVVIFIAAKPVEGWTTTILFLSVAFFGLFVVLSIIIKYLQVLLNLVFKRKQYCFESIEKLVK